MASNSADEGCSQSSATVMMKTRKRSKAFTYSENECLVNGVIENYGKLFGRSNVYSTESKEAIWYTIAASVSALGVSSRTAEVCKKRWNDCKTTVKNKISEHNKHAKGTGGGPPVELTLKSWEQALSKILAPEAVSGIPEGLDTGIKQKTHVTTSLDPGASTSSAPSVSSGPTGKVQFKRHHASEKRGVSEYTDHGKRLRSHEKHSTSKDHKSYAHKHKKHHSHKSRHHRSHSHVSIARSPRMESVPQTSTGASEIHANREDLVKEPQTAFEKNINVDADLLTYSSHPIQTESVMYSSDNEQGRSHYSDECTSSSSGSISSYTSSTTRSTYTSRTTGSSSCTPTNENTANMPNQNSVPSQSQLQEIFDRTLEGYNRVVREEVGKVHVHLGEVKTVLDSVNESHLRIAKSMETLIELYRENMVTNREILVNQTKMIEQLQANTLSSVSVSSVPSKCTTPSKSPRTKRNVQPPNRYKDK